MRCSSPIRWGDEKHHPMLKLRSTVTYPLQRSIFFPSTCAGPTRLYPPRSSSPFQYTRSSPSLHQDLVYSMAPPSPFPSAQCGLRGGPAGWRREAARRDWRVGGGAGAGGAAGPAGPAARRAARAAAGPAAGRGGRRDAPAGRRQSPPPPPPAQIQFFLFFAYNFF